MLDSIKVSRKIMIIFIFIFGSSKVNIKNVKYDESFSSNIFLTCQDIPDISKDQSSLFKPSIFKGSVFESLTYFFPDLIKSMKCMGRMNYVDSWVN